MSGKEYVTVEDVREACGKLGLRDWSAMEEPSVEIDEARKILALVNTSGMDIDEDDFRVGLEVELEHGTRFPDANVTNNHPVLTGKIVVAHLKETLDYYKRLDVMELEGDIVKAVAAGKPEKAAALVKRLEKARLALSQAVAKELAK